MIDYTNLYKALQHIPALRPWLTKLPQQVAAGLNPERWGELPQWQEALAGLPDIPPTQRTLNNCVRAGTAADATPQQRAQLEQQLRQLHPWRKGPWEIFGLEIDSEWRSDWKWNRIAPHLQSLDNRLVLDVGCGNGYHCWRLHGAGARRVIGIDPSAKFVAQFYALKKYLGMDKPVDVLPLALEALPPHLHGFDTTLSMGVLYHRRSPLDHLCQLRETLSPGGQLVIETLVIEGKLGDCLVPEGRYAKMRNIWFLPSTATLESWLRKAGFRNPHTVDINHTNTEEQRRTEWMHFESLSDFLDPESADKTIEGHPAPIRATMIATAV